MINKVSFGGLLNINLRSNDKITQQHTIEINDRTKLSMIKSGYIDDRSAIDLKIQHIGEKNLVDLLNCRIHVDQGDIPKLQRAYYKAKNNIISTEETTADRINKTAEASVDLNLLG